MIKPLLKTLVIVFMVLGMAYGPTAKAQVTTQQDTLLMGSRFVFTAIAPTWQQGNKAIALAVAEIVEIEKQISSWNKNSETSAINRAAGQHPVKVSWALFQLIERSKKVSEATQGFFDISYASIDPVWDFKKTYTQLPDSVKVLKSVALINFKNIILNPKDTTVFLKAKGMKIGFGGIGKGYAANRAQKIMQDLGIENGVVNAGGDLVSWGKKANGQPFTVGIANPKDKTNIRLWLNVTNTAVVTSGNYERFVVINGVQYGHIINPKTGWPTQELCSVTIICPDAELADALATAVFILGKEKGMALLNALDGVEGLLMDCNEHIYYSKNLEVNYLADE